MIQKVEEISITKTSYPFASAERYCNLSAQGYEEKEYYLCGTANVYESADEEGNVSVRTSDAPYVNRVVVRAPKDKKACSGNVVVEIINPTSFMEIDRMWILGYRQFLRNGDIYVGITSKPNTIAKMVEFNERRYSCLSWRNPTPEIPFSFTQEDVRNCRTVLPDTDLSYEPGLFWDMLTDLAWVLRSDDKPNPIRTLPHTHLYLTGWSQSACYLFRYLNSFAYRADVAKGGAVFDGYLAGGGVHSFVTPVNQYETLNRYSAKLERVEKSYQPFVEVHTESENGRFGGWRNHMPDSDRSEFLYRSYDVAGSSHDTSYSYVDYYQNDPDLVRIDHLPSYIGKEAEANDYPSQILFAAAFRNLFQWVRTGAAPAHCEKISVDAEGENVKDAFGNTKGGLRTCLLTYPTGRFSNTSTVELGQNFLDPNSEKEGLYGSQEPFSAQMLEELYGSLEHYEALATGDTMEQISRGFVVREDGPELIRIAVALAKARGLKTLN